LNSFFGGCCYKGIDIFLDALDSVWLSGVASIVGESRIRYQQSAEQIQQVPPTHKANGARFIPEHEFQRHFEQQLSCLLIGYRSECVLFTACRFGVPVVAFNVGSFSEYVPEFAGLIAAEKTPQSLAAALDAFYSIRGTYNRQTIRDYAAAFAWDKTVTSLIPHYSA